MIQIVIDLYPDEKSFYPHVRKPDDWPKRGKDRLRHELEWRHALVVMARMAKHLRRVGYDDRRTPGEIPQEVR